MKTLFGDELEVADVEQTIYRQAEFSPCRMYRYSLIRTGLLGQSLETCVIIGLNPSTADEINDDPTIRRCMDFARRFGCGRLVMLNLFAFRSTDPKVMKKQADPVGAENDEYLKRWTEKAKHVIAAWGRIGEHKERAKAVAKMFPGRLECLGVNKDGSPAHPLYLPASSTLIPWGIPDGSIS